MSSYHRVLKSKTHFWVLISFNISAVFYPIESMFLCWLPFSPSTFFLSPGYSSPVTFASSTASSQPLHVRVLPRTLSGPFLYHFILSSLATFFTIYVSKTSKSLSRAQTLLWTLDFHNIVLWMSQHHIKFNLLTYEIPMILFNLVIFHCSVLKLTPVPHQVP